MRYRWISTAFLSATLLTQTLLGAFSDVAPEVISRVAPEYPAALRAQRVIGQVVLICLVDEAGHPTKVRIEGQSQPEFGAAAKKALEQWRYNPGTREGRAQPMLSRVLIEFTLTDPELDKLEKGRTAEVLPPGPPSVEAYETSQMPKLKKEIRPELPRDLRGERSEVRIENVVVRFVVDEQGMPRDVHVLVTTSASCGPAAVEAVRKWRFEPARQDGKLVRVNMDVPIAFLPNNRWGTGARTKPGVSRDIVHSLPGREIVTFTGAPGEEPPKPVHEEEISFPDDMAMLDHGTVMIECIINPYGVVTHVRPVGDNYQYFAIAAERAFSHWRFTPPKKDGRPVYLRCVQPFTFRLRH